MASAEMKTCPFCAEEIRSAAIFCKHCRRDLPSENKDETRDVGSFAKKVDESDSKWLCPNCGDHNWPSVYRCVKCDYYRNSKTNNDNGGSSLRDTSDSRGTNKFWVSWTPARKSWTLIILAVTLIASLFGQNVFQFVGGVATGQVYLDSNKIATEIKNKIKDVYAIDAKVTCPQPMAGKVGETRQCTAVVGTSSYFFDVTIQSTSGDVTFEER